MVDILIVLRLAVACVFLVAVAGKLQRPHAFAEQLTVYVPGSTSQRRLVAWTVITVELTLAAGYGLGRFPVMTASVGLLVTALFAVLVIRRLSRDEGGPCLCFGADDGDTIGKPTLVRLGLLAGVQIALAADVVRSASAGAAGAATWAAPRDPSSAIAWAIAVTSLSAWAVRATDVAELFAIFLRRDTTPPAVDTAASR